MSFTARALKVPPSSASLEEARGRVFEFFKSACRSIPSIIEIYNLKDVATASQLQSTIATEIRKNAHIDNPKDRVGNPGEDLAFISYPLVSKKEEFVLFVTHSSEDVLDVIDLLLFKGTEDLANITEHAKQRHHIIGQYVVGNHGLVRDLGNKDQGISPFLKNFYTSNYF